MVIFQNCSSHEQLIGANSFNSVEQLRVAESKVMATFDSKCVHCHAPGSDLDITDVQSLIDAGHIVEGEPESSLLYVSIIDGIEPRDEGELSDEQIAEIRDWISYLGGVIDNVVKPPEVDDEGNPLAPGTYRQVAAIMNNRCLGCHRQTPPILASYDQVRATVIPGDAGSSSLYNSLARMPQANPLGFAGEEARRIRTWINSGANNN